MTELEKQIEIKRSRADAFSRVRERTAVVPEPAKEENTNFFAATTQVQNEISRSLKEFNTYKPADIAEMAAQIEAQQKPETVVLPNVAAKSEIKTKSAPRSEIKEPDYSRDFDNITHINAGTTVFEVPVPKEYQEQKFGVRLNLRGKLVVFMATLTMLCLLFLAIFNAVAIGNLKTDINSINREIFYEEEILDGLLFKYNELSDPDKLKDDAKDQGFVDIEELYPENIIEFGLLEETAAQAVKTNTNWFDAFCNFIYKLFGGKAA